MPLVLQRRAPIRGRRRWWPRTRPVRSRFDAQPYGPVADVDPNYHAYTDVAASTPATNGTEVKALEGISGNHFRLQGAGTATGPLLATNASPTGLTALAFATSDVLINNTLGYLFRGTQAFTLFMVVGECNVDAVIASWNTSTVNNDYGYWRARVASYTPDAQICFRRFADASAAEDKVDISTGWHVLALEFVPTGTVIRAFTDADSGSSATSGSNNSNINQMVLGGIVHSGATNGTLFATFKMGRLLAFDKNLTSTERLAIVSGLSQDWIGAPAAPTGVTATAKYHKILVEWAASAGASSYTIERSANGSTGWTTLASGISSNRFYYIDSGLSGGATWYYRVSAVNGVGSSSPSATVNATAGSSLSALSDILPFGTTGEFWNANNLPATITTWTGDINSKTASQSTGGSKPTRQANGSGTASFLARFDGTDDFLIADGVATLFQGDYTIAYALKLGAYGTAVRCHWIADDITTDNQTLDALSVPSSGALFITQCRENTATTEYSTGGWALDTNMHLFGQCGNADGTCRLFLDGSVSQYQRSRPAGSSFTTPNFTLMSHRRVSNTEFCPGDLGDVAVWPYEFDDQCWSEFDSLTRPRFGTATAAPADPILYLPYLQSRQWAAEFESHAGSSIADGTAIASNYDWGPVVGYLCELDNSTTSHTFETNESPTGLPAVACGSGGVWLENTPGTIAGKITAGAFSLGFITKANSLSGSAQTFLSVTDNNASGAHIALRANAAGAYEIGIKDGAGNSSSASGGTADTSIHYHLVTFDGASTFKWYVDNVLRVTLTAGAAVTWTLTRYVLGGLYRGSLGEGFTGLRWFEPFVVAYETNSTQRGQLTTYSVTRYGTPGAAQDVSPSSLTSTATFGSPTVTTGAVTVSPASLASGEALGTPTVTTGAVTVSPASLGSTVAFGEPTVSPGGVTVTCSGIGSAVTFGEPVVGAGGATVSPDGIGSTAALGSPTVTEGGVSVAPDGIGSSTAFGAPAVSTGAVSVALEGIPSGVGVGAPTVTPGAVTLALVGIASGVAFGVPVLTVGEAGASGEPVYQGRAVVTPVSNRALVTLVGNRVEVTQQ